MVAEHSLHYSPNLLAGDWPHGSSDARPSGAITGCHISDGGHHLLLLLPQLTPDVAATQAEHRDFSLPVRLVRKERRHPHLSGEGRDRFDLLHS